MITLCFTYFRSLTLAHLRAALVSVSLQDLSRVSEMVVVDNNTDDPVTDILNCIESLHLSIPVKLLSSKHGDETKTHAWSTNLAVRESKTPWVFFTRADYLLDREILRKCVDVVVSKPEDWQGFVTGHGYHLNDDIAACASAVDLRLLPGAEVDYTSIDSGVWMTTRQAFDHVNGLDQSLSAWGHVQTHFQHKLFKAGVEFVRIPEVLFYHPRHAAPRDLLIAHQQLLAHGVDLKEMWSRYEGVSPY